MPRAERFVSIHVRARAPPPPRAAAAALRRRLNNSPPLSNHPLQPCFVVPAASVSAFEALLPRFLAATAAEPGCLFYEWTRGAPDSGGGAVTFFCREGFADGAAAAAHVANVGEVLKEALPSLARAEVHGPAAETARVRLALPGAAYSTTGARERGRV
jgi:quinol monooxygenase YgiN